MNHRKNRVARKYFVQPTELRSHRIAHGRRRTVPVERHGNHMHHSSHSYGRPDEHQKNNRAPQYPPNANARLHTVEYANTVKLFRRDDLFTGNFLSGRSRVSVNIAAKLSTK